MTAFDTGAFVSTTLPVGLRTYYEAMLLESLRQNSIFVPYCIVKEDFKALSTGTITYTEVADVAPNWNALTEATRWLEGGHLDSRQISISLEIHGEMLKFHDS